MLKIFIRKIRTVIKDPKSVLVKALYFVSPIFSDRIYLKMLFPLKAGYKLDLDNPKTYNQKLQWLKINYREPEMSRMVDKYEAKEYVKEIIGEEYVIKSYGVWNSFDEIDFDTLPNSFVLKTTHDQGGVIIVKDKKDFNKIKAKKKLEKHLKSQHYYLTREWPYKDVNPRILAEEYLTNESIGDLYDYKFYCFHGKPEVMYISHGRHSDICYFDFYDMGFNHLDIDRRGYPQSNKQLKKPENWDLMIELAEKLSKNVPHVRVDFYNIQGHIYIGEMTFFQGGGMMPFYPQQWDYTFGNWIDLDKIEKVTN